MIHTDVIVAVGKRTAKVVERGFVGVAHHVEQTSTRYVATNRGLSQLAPGRVHYGLHFVLPYQELQ